MQSLFVEDPEDQLEVTNTEPHNEEQDSKETEIPENAHPTSLDRVELASLLKDFSSTDPLYANLPEYMVAIIKELLEQDMLVVLGRGLGLAQVLETFLRKIKQCSPNALVLVLGNHEDETANLVEEDDMDRQSAEAIGFGVPSSKRVKMYNKGGIYRTTAPITVVDILTKTLSPLNVSGLILTHAERINENSPTAFAIKLLKQYNKNMFVKAFSESPERLVMPPSLPVRLRILQVPTVMLWPRFHLLVDQSLPKLEVEEVIVEQPENVRRQQALLSELFQQVLSDIKRRVPHLDVEYLAPTLGSQQQLHANPEQSHATTTVDAVIAIPDLAFKIRNALQSVWHKLSPEGKRSVTALGTLAHLQHTLTQNDAAQFREELEFCCKDVDQPWVDLPATDLLVSEARNAAVVNRLPAKFYYLLDILRGIIDGQSVLILCNSPKTAFELTEFLERGMQYEQDEERLARLERELRERDELEAKMREQKRAEQINAGRPGRRRVRGGKSSQMTRAESQEQSKNSQDEEFLKEVNANESLKRKKPEDDDIVEVEGPAKKQEHISEFSRLDITISTFRENNLFALNPEHVILYDPNLTFTRELERFSYMRDQNSTLKLHVYFMYYQRSVEELQYLAIMRKEKDAFTKLIREKGLMPMVFTDEHDINEHFDTGMRVVKGNSEGGVAGAARRTYVTTSPHKVVVDAREFRSALPFFIWQQRMEVVPLTLLVGDYVLTPEIVVERKSITDLVGSFRNGRLYEQCESMLKHYKTAVLLIEFDGPNHFSMEPFREIRTRTTSDVQREIQNNLSSLIVRFPALRLIWSSSPMHSAQIFRSLKEAEPEPEPAECAMAGKSVLYDSLALSMLEALPGIQSNNAHLLANVATTMTEVARLSKQQLIDALGNENGMKLFRFLTSVEETTTDVSETQNSSNTN